MIDLNLGRDCVARRKLHLCISGKGTMDLLHIAIILYVYIRGAKNKSFVACGKQHLHISIDKTSIRFLIYYRQHLCVSVE